MTASLYSWAVRTENQTEEEIVGLNKSLTWIGHAEPASSGKAYRWASLSSGAWFSTQSLKKERTKASIHKKLWIPSCEAFFIYIIAPTHALESEINNLVLALSGCPKALDSLNCPSAARAVWLFTACLLQRACLINRRHRSPTIRL